jgi:glycosyltransferase involved in cell wall biosynthesis
MNIGIVTEWFERGAAYVSRAYLETLSQTHNVFIYARGGERFGRGEPAWDRDFVTWGREVKGMRYDYIQFGDLKRWAERRRLDAIIFNEQASWQIVSQARKLPVLLGAYVDYYTKDTVPFYWLYDFLLCNTRRHHGVFAEHPQAIFIPWGTDLQLFRPHSDALARPGQVTFFHSCGLSAWRKGTDILLKAFQHTSGPARLVIHAQTSLEQCFRLWTRGNEAQIARDLVSRDRRIELVEREVPAPGLYHCGDVYVYPTRLEGIGLTLAEASASGLPVITTDAPPMNEMVVAGSNGSLAPVDHFEPRWDGYYWPLNICSEKGLADAMQDYIDSRESLAAFKRRSRAYAEEHLDWRNNSALLLDKLPQLVRRRDLASRALLSQVRRFEQSQARLRWLPLSVEAWVRRSGTAWLYRAIRGHSS